MTPRARALAALALCACGGTTGTVQVELVVAPSSHVLDAVQRLRLTLTAPRQVVEATRTASGFDLAIELDTTNAGGALIVEGFDAADALIACGQSPSFPIAAINAQIAVYMAAPRTIAAAPAALRAPRSGLVATALTYGAVIAGGRDEAGAPAWTIAVYNAFDHSLVEGIPLPAARAGLAIATGSAGGVYLFGGTDAGGASAGTLWRFDTTVAPNGSYSTISEQAMFARSGEQLVAIGSEHYLITGKPALELASGVLVMRSDIAELPRAGATAQPDATPTAVFAGPSLVRFRGDAFEPLAGAGRTDATAVTLPDGRVAVLGGLDDASARDALVIDGATGTVTTVTGVLATPRARPAVAATKRHVIVAGGSDPAGAPIQTAEVLDAHTLTPVVTLAITTGGFALALPNDQVLLGGSTPASTLLELFTPEPP